MSMSHRRPRPRQSWHVLKAGGMGYLLAVFGLLSPVFAQEPEEAPLKAKPPAILPLQKVIEGILGGDRKRPTTAPTEDATAKGEAEQVQKDQIDLRAPLIREQESLLKSADTRFDRQQWSEGLEILQSILEEETESVVLGSDGQFHSIRWEAHRKIAEAPAPAQEMYRRTYGPLAQKLLDEAIKQSHFESIRAVAEHYFHTEAGYAAANRIAAQHLDMGEFAIAARWYRRLEKTSADFVADPLWRFKVGEVYRRVAFTESQQAPWLELTESEKADLQQRMQGKTLEMAREQWKSLATISHPLLRDWLYPGGNSNRIGHVLGTAPLLISHWQHSLVENPEITGQLQQLLEDLQLNRTPAIPIMQPLVVGSRVVFRTLEGLRVVDADSGELLWESRDEISPAQLLTGNKNVVLTAHRGGRAPVPVIGAYSGGQAEQHPLTNLLFRDGVHGTLSSDGKRVYVIEHNAVLSNSPPGNYYQNFSPAQHDPYRRDWTSNRLAAYDLETGHLEWHVGGRKFQKSLDRPLAGHFFFGPPLAEGGELFLVGEYDSELRLFCLQANEGKVLWSQLLSYTDVSIERDLGRRWWPCQVALSEGVLVCPTNVGFLVGVDRRSHEILWISRYSDRQPEQQQQQMQFRGGSVPMSNPGSLRDRWFITPPMIVGQTVIFAGQEESMLAAYRLTDGKQRWRIPEFKLGLYPLGCYQSELVVVTQIGLSGFNVDTGEKEWEVPFSRFDPNYTREGGLPCGRGVIMGDQALLPLNEQEIWTFDLQNKEFVARSQVSEEGLTLGNLVMAHGRLVVASPEKVMMFQPKLEVEQEIAKRLEQQAQDAWALMKQAEILSLDQKYSEALAKLQNVQPEGLEAEMLENYRQQMFESLVGTIEKAPQEHEAEFALLKGFVQSDQEQQRYLRLQADRKMALKDFAGAFQAYAQLAQHSGEEQIRASDDPSLMVRQDVWLHSRLKQLWKISTGEVSSQISETVQKSVKAALEANDTTKMLQVMRLYGFHPQMEELYLPMIELATAQGNIPLAEFALNQMSQQADPSVAATAMAQRIELLDHLGFTDDSLYFVDQLAQYESDLVLLNGYTIQEWLEEQAEKRAEQNAETSPVAKAAPWSGLPYEVIPIGTANWHHQPGIVNLNASEVPYAQQHRFHFHQKAGRLEIIHRESGKLVWSIPLQQLDQQPAPNILPVYLQGHQLITSYRGVIQCYSLLDQKLVWSHPMNQHTAAGQQLQPTSKNVPRLQQAHRASGRFRLNHAQYEFGPLVLVSPGVVCYLGRNELIALDPMDGKVRWTRRGAARASTVYGDEKALCLIPPNMNEAQMLNSADGTLIPTPNLSGILTRGIGIAGQTVVGVSKQELSPFPDLSPQEETLNLMAENLITQEVVWERMIGKHDYIGVFDEQHLMRVESSGQASVIEITTGKTVSDFQIDEAMMRNIDEFHVFAEHDQLFLLVNQQASQTSYLSIKNLRVNGYLAAFDRREGTQLWMHKTPAMNLPLDNLQQMPVFVFCGTKHERRADLYFGTLDVQVVDKQTGQVLFDQSMTSQNQLQQITWSDALKQLRLHAYNSVFLIRPRTKPQGQKTE